MTSLADQLYLQRYGTSPLQGLSGLPGANDPFIAAALITPYAQRTKEQHNAINTANVTASGGAAPQYQSSSPQTQQMQQPPAQYVQITNNPGGTADRAYARIGSQGQSVQNRTPNLNIVGGYQQAPARGQQNFGFGNFGGMQGYNPNSFSSPMSGMNNFGFPQQRQQSAPMQGAGSMNTTPTPQRTRPPALSQNFNNMLYYGMSKPQYY